MSQSSDYVIIRGGGALGNESVSSGPSISVEPLTDTDALDASRDPAVVALAPRLKLKLIKPMNIAPQPAATGEATWGVKAVGAHTSPFDGSGIRVAVIDSGIDASHEAFSGINLIQRDFTGEGNGDADGHGTHCAGTIFGRTGPGGMRIGVAPGVSEALIARVFGANEDNNADTPELVQAVLWARENGANVISMSLGFDLPGATARLIAQGFPEDLAASQILVAYRQNVRLFDRLGGIVHALNPFGHGTVLVAASGNESHREVHPAYTLHASLPSEADGFLSVGALMRGTGGLSVADFSNTYPHVSAPGVDVLSAKPGGGYQLMDGTSMATPHVAGVAALWAQQLLSEPGADALSSDQLRDRLRFRATTSGLAPGFLRPDVGEGLVQAPQS